MILHFGLMIATLLSASPEASPAPAPDMHAAALAKRLFPVVQAIHADRLSPSARRMLAERAKRVAACATIDAACVLSKASWTSGEIDQLASAIARVGALDTQTYVPDDGAVAQVRRELTGLNSVLRVYGEGQPGRNPKLDGPLEKIDQPQFATRRTAAIQIARAGRQDGSFDPSIELATSLLDANDDDEAIAFDPVDARYNAAARSYAAAIDWNAHPFTAIVVLGNGPETEGEALSPRGKLRVRLAAGRYFAGAAPLIVVSGGAVHPRDTAFSEAVEMRRALIERYGVPERSIVVEPYARYTSTNLRNATRRLFAIGAPVDREVIVLTDPDHSVYVAGDRFHDRSVTELGYFPGRIGRRLSPAEVTLTPSISSLRIDPLDPLDP